MRRTIVVSLIGIASGIFSVQAAVVVTAADLRSALTDASRNQKGDTIQIGPVVMDCSQEAQKALYSLSKIPNLPE